MARSPRVQPDPLLEPELISDADADFPAHVSTYKRIMSMARWFAFHLFMILVALYFAVIAGNPGLGVFVVLLALAIMIFAFMRRRPVREDVRDAMRAGGPAAHA